MIDWLVSIVREYHDDDDDDGSRLGTFLDTRHLTSVVLPVASSPTNSNRIQAHEAARSFSVARYDLSLLHEDRKTLGTSSIGLPSSSARSMCGQSASDGGSAWSLLSRRSSTRTSCSTCAMFGCKISIPRPARVSVPLTSVRATTAFNAVTSPMRHAIAIGLTRWSWHPFGWLDSPND